MPSVDLSGSAGGGGAAPGGAPASSPDKYGGYGAGFGGFGQGGGAPAAGGFGGGSAGGYGGAPAAASPGYGGGQTGGLGAGGFGAQAAQGAVQAHLQQAAYDGAQQGLQAARVGASQAVSELHKYVQEGPAGISMLCFVGGGATTLAGVIGLLNIGSSITSPFNYVLNGYLTLFGLVTFLLEADMESFARMKILGKFAPFVDQYQAEVFSRAKFLTELRGRGFFYLFVGSLAITQCFFCLFFLIGAWNVLMGVLCLLMSFGINPTENLVHGPGSPEQHVPLYTSPHGP